MRAQTPFVRWGHFMNLDLLAHHHAVAEWRDRAILEAARMLNQAGTTCLAAFDGEISEASIVESAWDPASFANLRIDRAMLACLRVDLPALLTRAAQELARIVSAQTDFVEGAREAADKLAWPEVQEEAGTTESLPEEESPAAASTSRVSRIGRLAQTLSTARFIAADTVVHLSGTASRSFKDRSGLDDRLRSAARRRITEGWMALISEPQSIMAQVIEIIDDRANLARSAA